MNGDPEIKRIDAEASIAPKEEIVDANMASQREEDSHVSISLKYYKNKPECFSEWDWRDLKAFSGLIEKLRSFKWIDLQARRGPTCNMHVRGRKVAGFSRPLTISEDMDFYDIHVGRKARIHGFHANSVFYLVWLDKNHNYHPDR